MADLLKDKVAIVTGAGSGMGRQISELFVKEGAKVMLADINPDGLKQTAAEIDSAGDSTSTVIANVAKEDDIVNMVKETVDTYSKVDILVNNAGIVDNIKTVENTTDDIWDRVLAINLTGPFKAAREAIKYMLDQKDGGTIINMASVGGLFGSRGGVAYTATKHGIIGLTKNIAATYGIYHNIRANAIAPGNIATNIQKTINDPDELGMKALTAIGGMTAPGGKPEQIAQVALFLASDQSKFVNGAVITADGGWTSM
ncbi:SDR family oxidoreductase [Lentilactobacillus sp. IMAU92037]|uniref:SDR family oxidoreductase n=1 Tax=Lentilactobacillus TaxID=2767893 RepID=UPI001C28011F|nr:MULTISPECIES: SDR family oxidoreductase [Lentilactobacillus]MBU9789434.1 SDR family oxidoreductase [Lentilactobacillus dabitei]MBV0930705.1 SDR family oxidoreductase [Lentilactobacillus dabitei]MDM7516451.1 SDR family oxidoreductase [Lentilactobacillus sp. TOM.63]